MSSGAPGRKLKPRSVSSSCLEETPRSSRMKSGETGPLQRAPQARRMAASRYWIRSLPSLRRLIAKASGSRSMPSNSRPVPSRAAACPPSPSVASTARCAPLAAASTGSRSTGTCVNAGLDRSCSALTGRNTTPRLLDGVPEQERAGLTGLEPATSAVTVRHSNQAELQPPFGGRNIDGRERRSRVSVRSRQLKKQRTLEQAEILRVTQCPTQRLLLFLTIGLQHSRDPRIELLDEALILGHCIGLGRLARD